MRAPFAVDVFVPKPVGRTEKLARENVGLHLLSFARRIAFYPAGAAIDRVAAESVRAHRNLVVWIAVQAVVADLVCDHDLFLGRILVFRDIDKPGRAIEKTEDALVDDATRLIMANFKIVVAERGSDQRFGTPITLGSFQRLLVACARLAPDVDPCVHALVLAKPVALPLRRHGTVIDNLLITAGDD